MYNAAPYIERCLNSVFNQDIAPENLEIIIVNDGSPDNSEEIAKELSRQKENVRIFTQRNKGLGGARNTGIEKALGEYIIFLDADDYLEPNCLSKIHNEIKSIKFQDVDVFELGCKLVSEQDQVLTTLIPEPTEQIYTGIEYYLKTKNISSACNKLYKREALGDLRFKERIYVEDSEFNTRAYFFFKKCCALDLILSNFVQTRGSITRNRNEETKNKLLQDTLEILHSFKRFELENSNNTYFEKEYFSKKYTLYNVTIFNLLIKYNMKVSKALEIRKELQQESLFILDYKGLEGKKNLFRILLKYSFLGYISILTLRNRTS